MAELPSVPSGKELEDYVAASLQCAGYFVEKGLIEHGPADVLELDIIATTYPEGMPSRLLIEVKSGDWGFADIFKLLGWKTYLSAKGLDHAACFVASRLKDDAPIDFFQAKCSELDVRLIAVDGHERLNSTLSEAGLVPGDPGNLEHSLWRFSLWLERRTVDIVAQHRKARHDREGHQ